MADSTAVLGTKNSSSWEGVALTRDHKPNLKDEKARPSAGEGILTMSDAFDVVYMVWKRDAKPRR